MHKQHPQTAYRKDAVLIGTIFENCDNIKKVFICVQNSLKIKGSFGLQLLYEYAMITLKTVCVSTDQTGSV